MEPSCFASLTVDTDVVRVWRTQEAARSKVVQFEEGWYNCWRHSALDYLMPVEFESRQRPEVAQTRVYKAG